MKMGCCALSFLLAVDCVRWGRGSPVIERASVFGSSVEQEKSATALRFHMVAEH